MLLVNYYFVFSGAGYLPQLSEVKLEVGSLWQAGPLRRLVLLSPEAGCLPQVNEVKLEAFALKL